MPVPSLVRILLALLLLTTPAFAQPITISGSVAYRERIALPDGAFLRIALVALPSGNNVVGATADIPAKGQPPLAFSLNVHRPLPDKTYGLIAEIHHGSRILFRNAEPVIIDPSASRPVTVMVQSVPQTPVQPIPAPPSALIDTLWTVTSIGGKPVTGDRPVTLTIAADLRASGNSGCNNYFAETSISGNGMSFGPAAATRMACAPELMTQESAFFSVLAAVTAFDLEADRLRLLDAADIPLIGLVKDED